MQNRPTRVGRVWNVVLTLGAFSSLLCRGTASGDFEALVADRTTIERIYHAHRLGNKPPFELFLPRTAIESLVRADLKRETILKQVYGINPTPADIEAELRRIDAETRAPEMLAEIKRALGNDTARFALSVARPAVVEQELRRHYENDDRLHATQRQQVEAARRKILAAPPQSDSWKNLAQTLKETKVGTVANVAWQLGARPEGNSACDTSAPVAAPMPVKAGSHKYSINAIAQFAPVPSPLTAGTESDQRLYFEDLSDEMKAVLRVQLLKPGDVSAVIETPTGFLLFVVKERTTAILSAGMLSIPKRSFDQWLAEQKE